MYSAGELREAAEASEMRKAGFDVKELRAASWLPDALKRGGFSAKEMREGGYSTSQTFAAVSNRKPR